MSEILFTPPMMVRQAISGALAWEVITGEYPPQTGGVADYTRNVAQALAARGDRVRIWTADCGQAISEDGQVAVKRISGGFSFPQYGDLPGAFVGQGVILLQYVPHAFGWKAMNLPFCCWLFLKRKAQIWVVFHEVAVAFSWRSPLKTALLACLTSLMALLVARAATRIWVTIPAWEQAVRRLAGPEIPIRQLSVPSAVLDIATMDSVVKIKRSLVAEKVLLLGHFGTYRQDSQAILYVIVPRLLREVRAHLVLLGEGSIEFRDRLIKMMPELASRITATGRVEPLELSNHLKACDLLVQPYPDGVSGRRTSAMACLAHGCALLTNAGPNTEEIWKSTRAVVLTESDDQWLRFIERAKILAGSERLRARLQLEAAAFYRANFDINTLVNTLRESAIAPCDDCRSAA